MTDHLPCGKEVFIDLSEESSVSELKTKLESATGVPTKFQKVMLSGIGDLMMGDKRCISRIQQEQFMLLCFFLAELIAVVKNKQIDAF